MGVIRLKKYIILISLFVVIAGTFNIVKAKSSNSNGNSNQGGQQINNLKENPSFKDDIVKNTPPARVGNGTNTNDSLAISDPLKNTIRKMERLEEKIQNKEEKAEVGEIVDEQEVIDNTIDESLDNMNARPGLLKLIMGPDYKNAGQVRSEIVRLQNQIRQLTRMSERLSVSENTVLDDAILTLKTELNAIETKLYTGLQGFSLFGWLNRLMTGFVPVPTSTPVESPTAIPSVIASPTVVSSPIPTDSVTP